MTARGQKGVKIALLQLSAGFNKVENVDTAMFAIRRAKEDGAQLVVLPELFNSPYGTEHFEGYAEEVPSGSTCRALARAAAEANVFVIGGTLPESYGNKFYNTCTVWSDRGKLLAIHRQMHFFKVDLRNTQNLHNSSTFTAGAEITTFEYEGTKIGIGIYHDLFFPEMAHLMSRKGCSLLVYLGAYGKLTGAESSEVLARSRAGDEQLWVALMNSNGDSSILVDPRTHVVARTDHDTQTLMADIDLNLVEEVRRQISIRALKVDVYTVHMKPCCSSRVSSGVGRDRES